MVGSPKLHALITTIEEEIPPPEPSTEESFTDAATSELKWQIRITQAAFKEDPSRVTGMGPSLQPPPTRRMTNYYHTQSSASSFVSQDEQLREELEIVRKANEEILKQNEDLKKENEALAAKYDEHEEKLEYLMRQFERGKDPPDPGVGGASSSLLA